MLKLLTRKERREIQVAHEMTHYTNEKRSTEPIHVLLLKLYILKQTLVNKAHTGFSMDNTMSNKLNVFTS